MTPIYDRPIHHPSAWTSAAIGGKEGLTLRLEQDQLEALARLAAETSGQAPDALTRAEFDDPAIDALMQDVRGRIMDGPGAVILSGIDIERYPLEDFSRLYWGLGTHLGEGAIQSARGDRIGFVQKEENNPDGRGYQLDIELRSHCDFHEILGLASVRTAAQGGESGVVSALAIHNVLREEAPDRLAALYEGYYHGYADPDALTKEKVPVFCNVGGTVSCFYHALFMLNAARQRGEELPRDLRAAMTALGEIAQRPEIRADFMLEPGEILLWHNFVILHSRRAFTNAGERKRLLLRLWLHVENGRTMHPEFAGRARLMDRIHAAGATALNYASLGLSTSVEQSLAAVAGT